MSISYDFARLCRNKCSICNEGQEFVPRLTFRVQTGDKNVEKIGITKENTFPKTIILPYLNRFFSQYFRLFTMVLSDNQIASYFPMHNT